MVVWALTAGIGIYLLAVGIAGQRTAATVRSAGVATTPAPAVTPAPAAEPDPQTGDEEDDAGEGASVVGAAALTLVLEHGRADGRPQAAEGSALLEFVHPALALLGLTFWIFFVMSGYRAFAWISFGVVVATVTAGLSWEIANRRAAARRRDGAAGGAGFPPHLIMLHGAAAACTFALVIIAAVVASHG
jgi:hypothetical protein